MAHELRGKIKHVLEPKTFASGFTVREFVLYVQDGKYPQEIIMQCCQDKVTLLDDFRQGDEVDVTFDIRGREYNGRWFNNLQVWKMVAVSKRGEQAEEPPPDDMVPDDFDEYEDDIPF